MIVPIETASDARIAPYRGVRERDLIRTAGLFIVEGAIALDQMARGSRFPLVSVFLLESRLAPLADLLARLDPDLPVYVARPEVMRETAGFDIHRGVLALAQRRPPPLVADLLDTLPAHARVLGLIGLSNHDNVGACFRNAAAFGADAVALDAASCDPLYRKAIRVSSGATLSVPFTHGSDGRGLIEDLDRAGFESWALTPRGGEPLTKLAPPQRLALLLGAEGPGLPDDLMNRSRRVTIPMAPGFDSLNVATAGAIALAHVFAR
jgi:tRNA G18 (ribose-2'-O)-methylase SpoU